MTDKRTALVLGATGGIGGEVALALLQGGWHVRSLHREPERAAGKVPHLARVQWVAGDAMRREDVVAAAEGADVIVHGVNPPGYRNWRGLALPMLENSITAAKASGARLVFPGTVYNFGPDAFPNLSERSPQNPTTRKGKIRVEMERRLEAASRDGVRTLIVRAGDFFGPRTGNSWFAQGLIKPGKPVRSILLSGPARCRPRLGLPTGRGGNHRPAARPGGAACRLRRISLRRPLVRARHRDGPCHSAGRRRAAPDHPPISLGSGFRCQSVRHRIPRDAGASLSLAAPGAARQCEAHCIPGRRAAHPD